MKTYSQTIAKALSLLLAATSLMLAFGCQSSKPPGGVGGIEGTTTQLPDFPALRKNILGKWEGMYHSYPVIVRLELELKPEGETSVVGEAVATILKGKLPFHGDTEGWELRWTVYGDYVKDSQRIDLRPTKGRIRSGSTFSQLHTLQLVYARTTNRLAGTIKDWDRASSPFVTLARAQDAAGMFSRVKTSARGGGFSTDIFSFGVNSAIDAWTKSFKMEYPEIDPYHTAHGVLEQYSRKLFSDSYFRPHFGTPYDQLSIFRRKAIARNLKPPYSAFNGAFTGTGTYTADDYTVSTIGLRHIREWHNDILIQLAQLPASIETFDRIGIMEKITDPLEVSLWPSEVTQFKNTIAATRQRIADPTLILIAKNKITSAHGYAGAKELVAWLNHRSLLHNYASAQVIQESKRQVQARLSELLEVEVAADLKRFDKESHTWGQGIAAYLQGNAWYLAANNKYGDFNPNEGLIPVIQPLQRRRGFDLESAAFELAKRFEEAWGKSDVDEQLRNILIVPGDTETSGGQLLTRVADFRKQAIEQRNTIIAHSLLALVFENIRPDATENPILESLFRYARDQQIEALLAATLEGSTREDRANLRFAVTAFLDIIASDRRTEKTAGLLTREMALRKFKEKYPDIPFGDLMLDIAFNLAEAEAKKKQ